MVGTLGVFNAAATEALEVGMNSLCRSDRDLCEAVCEVLSFSSELGGINPIFDRLVELSVKYAAAE